jgi:WD repeat-containing protein 24
MSSTQSESPSESPKNHSVHRHAGEGVLDDSDSSDSGGAEEESKAEGGVSSDEESGLRPLISPHQSTRVVPTTPSPLSHIAGQHLWTEDEEDDKEDDEASPSPGSTDTESSSSEGSTQQKKSKSIARRNSRTKSRSRSSTVASLAASSPLQVQKPLVHQQSQSSIRTVIAGDAPVGELDLREDTVMDMSGKHRTAFSPESRKTQRSQAASSDVVSNVPEEVDPGKVLETPYWAGNMSEKRKPSSARWVGNPSDSVEIVCRRGRCADVLHACCSGAWKALSRQTKDRPFFGVLHW